MGKKYHLKAFKNKKWKTIKDIKYNNNKTHSVTIL
uniref:Uncharacterized protein n=1 Tax=Anguilla anguilla TaxID=7936 RepID=A0A0E9SI45_ANGAN